MVGADLVSFITSHHEPDFLGLLMLEETNIARATLLPLFGRSFEPE